MTHSMNYQGPKLAKFLQFILKFAIFVLLLVVCYIFFMEEAIAKFQKRATTVTEKSIPIEDLGGYKSPAIVICPNPAFKPSISDLHGFKYPTRDLFNMRTPFSEKYKYLFNKTPVRSLFEAFSYTENDLEIKAFGTTLNEGDNQVKSFNLHMKMNFELKKIRTENNGICHLIQSRNIENWKEKGGSITVQYKKSLSVSDVPKSLKIYFVERDEWQGKNIYPYGKRNIYRKLLFSQTRINNSNLKFRIVIEYIEYSY